MLLSGFEVESEDHRGATVQVRSGPKGIVVAALGIVALLVGIWLLYESWNADPLTRWVVTPFILIGMSLFPLSLVYLRRRVNPLGLIPRRLAAGACGACGYQISTLPREPDGCTVCPECGAAWELEEETGEKEQMAK